MATDNELVNWGDDVDDTFLEEEPGRFESSADDRGVKTITEIQSRDGKTFRITKKVRVIRRTKRINTRAEERLKNWKPFGKAVNNDPSITVTDKDHMPFDLSGGKKKQSSVDRKINKELEALLAKTTQKGEVVDGNQRFVAKSLRPGGKPSANAADDKKSAAAESSDKNAYRPPSMRAGGGDGGRTMGGRDDGTYTIRVSNLSEDITEQDLRDLFGTYGQLQRVFLAKDRTTRESKGFAFINYYKKADAEMAIQKVSGFGYNHLILQVEWARPSNN